MSPLSPQPAKIRYKGKSAHSKSISLVSYAIPQPLFPSPQYPLNSTFFIYNTVFIKIDQTILIFFQSDPTFQL